MATTAENVAQMAEWMRLNLTAQELAQITATVERTGSLAPEADTIAQFQAGHLSPAALTFFLPWLWQMRPDASRVPTEVWRGMFQCAAYTENRIVQQRPRRTFRAYRGATLQNRDGLSWSLDVEQAKYFARSRQAPGAIAHLWVTNIPPERLFARYTEGFENEVTADVRGLDVYPLEEEHRLPRPRRPIWGFWSARG
jgi:hypothetical protein